jgi:hypothetical protein
MTALLFSPLLYGQPPTPGSAEATASGGTAASAAIMPGYWILNQESVQRELRLTSAQRLKFETIAREYQERFQRDLAKIRDLPREEQNKRLQELQRSMAKVRRHARADIEKELRPEQVEQLREIDFLVRAGMAIYDPQAAEQLGISHEQKGKLQNLQKKLQEQMLKLQKENVEQALKLLTRDQVEQLRQQVDAQPF